MAFFNKKEEVIDIQLTQYGKHLLSRGKFKPIYYAFYDDNILYDIAWASGSVESQNDIEGRIQENTPNVKTQYVFHGVETNIKKANPLLTEGMESRWYKEDVDHQNPPAEQAMADRFYSISYPLGTSRLADVHAPSFNIKYLKGVLTGSTTHVTGAHQTLRVPQLHSDVTYEVSAKQDDNYDATIFEGAGTENDLSADYIIDPDIGRFGTIAYSDGTYVDVKGDSLILEINEEHVPFANDNFDIEVFIAEEQDVSGTIRSPGVTNPTTREVLKRLVFQKETNPIQNNILLDDYELAPQATHPKLGQYNVEYYLDFKLDDEIDEDLLCQLVTQDIPTDVFDSSRTLECSDKQQAKQLNKNPYGEDK